MRLEVAYALSWAVHRRVFVQRAMGSFIVVSRVGTRRRCASLNTMTLSSHSRRIDPTVARQNRSPWRSERNRFVPNAHGTARRSALPFHDTSHNWLSELEVKLISSS